MLAQAREPDFLALCIAVLLDVGFGTLEDDTALLLVGLNRQAVSGCFFRSIHVAQQSFIADSDPKDG